MKLCRFATVIGCLSIIYPVGAQAKWAASWATSIQGAYGSSLPLIQPGAVISAYEPQPDLSFALPDATTRGATDQTFRLIIKPDLWSDIVRVKLSNVFGSQPVTFGAASIALQDYQANIVNGTSTPLTFGGARSVRVQKGAQIYSDPIRLSFVDRLGTPALYGRNLAVSLAVRGSSGPASYHDGALVTSYISSPGSGDTTAVADDTAFPYSTTSTFFLSELDVQAPNDTIVVAAFGDSITDGTFSTLNGNDRWSNTMSRKLHDALGSHVSVVNEGIAGNAVTGTDTGPSAVSRVGRDVVDLAGVNIVVWLEGINDLAALQVQPAEVIEGYKAIIQQLHGAGIATIGATLTSSYPPGGIVPSNSPLITLGAAAPAANYASAQTNMYRLQLNSFILSSRQYDGVADFAAATTDPTTGSLYTRFTPNSQGSAGDYLHPNRAGYQTMGTTAAEAVLKLLH